MDAQAYQAYIMQIQPFSVNDGDGIRSTIFMAGCPLRCRWCSNPEGFTAAAKIGWYERKCIGCGACAKACPQGIGINMNINMNARSDQDAYGSGAAGTSVEAEPGRDRCTAKAEPCRDRRIAKAEPCRDRCNAKAEPCRDRRIAKAEPGRSRCTACGRCVEVCPVEARTHMVKVLDADEILKEIQKHRLFYAYSGGGITFSGGEATSQPEILDFLSREIYDMGYSMDIETCGMFDWDKLAHILVRMDLIFMDLKIYDPEKHREYTGVSNEKILENIAKLAAISENSEPIRVLSNEKIHEPIHESIYEYADSECRIGNNGRGPRIVIRIPVIGGVNDDDENIRASAAYVHRLLPNARMELLPYHSYGKIKYEALGISYDHPEFRTPDKAELERLKDIVRSEGAELADYR